jgi:hypothetical protein
MNKNVGKNKQRENGNEDARLKPDPETLGTTDPQEHMKGPISTLVKKMEEGAKKNDRNDEKGRKKDR